MLKVLDLNLLNHAAGIIQSICSSNTTSLLPPDFPSLARPAHLLAMDQTDFEPHQPPNSSTTSAITRASSARITNGWKCRFLR